LPGSTFEAALAMKGRTMRNLLPVLALVAISGAPLSSSAQESGSRPLRVPVARDVDATGSLGGRAPWQRPWEYDSGSDNDRFPDRPYYQQGRGQQTGGPARNLLPDDGLHLFPR
jgi:hypothetical protein